MAFSAGDRLGPYEILGSLGAGGMGVVYQARDTRLGRVVALKVLAADQLADPEQRLRFLREARAASALNHPNIVTIYDVGSENGIDYLAMEYVAGKTLDQIIPASGMRLNELLRCAAQVADALAKAHHAGIVHRDLKPSNVMVSSDGVAKVLDFGLAKIATPAPAEGDTQTMKALTGAGAILGTTFYMSPEQAEAKPVDSRSDIFSFGIVLYEMATGKRPFTGGSQIAVLSSILREDPQAPVEVRGEIPAELSRTISRCLRKDPARRFQHMADLKVSLEELKEESESGKHSAARSIAKDGSESRASQGSHRLAWIFGAVAVVAVAVAGIAIWLKGSGAPLEPVVISNPIPLTSSAGNVSDPSLSPDGNQVAYAWSGEADDNMDIYIKLVGPGSPLRLTTNAAADYLPRWSPDGRSIAFIRGKSDAEYDILTVPALGGPEQRIGSFPMRGSGPSYSLPSFSWTSDSKALVVSTTLLGSASNALVWFPLDGRPPRALTHPPASASDAVPAVSLDNRKIVFVRVAGAVTHLLVQPVSAAFEPEGDATRVEDGDIARIETPEWMPNGREVIFASRTTDASGTINRVGLDSGAKPYVVPGLGLGVSDAAVAAHGNRLVFVAGSADANFWEVDLATKTASMNQRLSSTFRDVFPQYSPDGKRVAFYSNRGGTPQVWVANRDGSQAAALTSMTGPVTGTPRWSPDGKQIAFDSNGTGDYQAYVMPAEGGQSRLISQDKPAFFTNWSRDGKWIYFTSKRTGEFQIWKVPAAGGEQVQVTRAGGTAPSESPDGKFVYYTKDSTPSPLWKMPVDGGPETQVVDDVFRANYVVTDKGVYFMPRDVERKTAIKYLNFATGAVTEIVKVPKRQDSGLTISPDGKTLMYSQVDYASRHLMLVEGFK